ncbi:MAG TPA: sialidase family protein [Casimicrobiaceae bacterium]
MRIVRNCACVVALVAASVARADFATFVIDEVYSNADGSVQYVVLREAQGVNGGNLLAGRTLTATHAGVSKAFMFPTDLPTATTANQRVLIGSNGFAALSPIAPDYQMPDRFLPTDGGTVTYAGVDQITYAALPVDGSNALRRSGAVGANLATNFAGQTFAVPANPITVVEFYNDSLDHYFMSPLAPDIDALDSGRIAGWSRTGYAFDAFPTMSAALNPVCRFYIPPIHGDSHFFSASPSECTAVLAKIGVDPNYSDYIYETPSEFYILLPNTANGDCSGGLIPTPVPAPVWRLWNNRADSNHRYTTDANVRAQMVARGYVSEGYGPLGVAMCTQTAKIDDSRVRVTGASPFVVGCDGTPATGIRYTNAEVEPMVAVNLSNTNNLIGVWQQDRWSNGGSAGLRTGVSRDGGRSWSITQAPFSRCTGGTAANGGNYARATDPWVAITPSGTAFQIALGFNGGTFAAGSQSAVLVSRSTDNGLTWSDATPLIVDGSPFFNDKESITADRYNDGYVYATWDRLAPSGNGPSYFARTTDNGVTWESARSIFDPGGNSQTINNQIVALPPSVSGGSSTIVNFFTQIDPTANVSISQTRLALIRSADNGATWGAPIYVADITAVGTRDPETGTQLRDGAILGSFASATNGQLAAVWQDARFSAGVRDGIAFSRSLDGGITWATPVQVNSVPSVQALLPAVTIRDDGTIGILYYDMRNNTSDPGTLIADAWLATSKDGVVWQETHAGGPFNFANAPMADGGLFIGDYQAIVSDSRAFYPFFAMVNPSATNKTDVFASAFRSIVAPSKAAPAKAFEARTAPALVPTAEVLQRLQERITRTLQWRRVGG